MRGAWLVVLSLVARGSAEALVDASASGGGRPDAALDPTAADAGEGAGTPDAPPVPVCSDDPAPPRPADLPDWSHAGYRGGLPLPDASKLLATIDVAAEHGRARRRRRRLGRPAGRHRARDGEETYAGASLWR